MVHCGGRVSRFRSRSGVPSAAGFHPGYPLFAERTFVCGPGVDGEADGAPDRILDKIGTAVDDARYADNFSATVTDDLGGLLRRLPGRDDIFADNAACAFGDDKAAAQRHDTILTFNEDTGFTQLASQLIRDDDATHGGPDDEVEGHRVELLGSDCQNARCAVGILQEPCTLAVTITMPAGCEQKMPLKQGSGFLEFVQNQFVGCHILLLSVLQFWDPPSHFVQGKGVSVPRVLQTVVRLLRCSSAQ